MGDEVITEIRIPGPSADGFSKDYVWLIVELAGSDVTIGRSGNLQLECRKRCGNSRVRIVQHHHIGRSDFQIADAAAGRAILGPVPSWGSVLDF